MLFNSLPFAAFALVVFVAYYLPPFRRHQVLVLVAASMVFYAWSAPKLLLLLVASVAGNTYVSGRVARDDLRTAPRWAAAGIVLNLAVLAFFKYGNLLGTTFQRLAYGEVRSAIGIALPIGISFYTFEGISLVVDTLRLRRAGKPTFIDHDPVEHWKRTALFVVFFPHLIAGPILKARQFFPQIAEKRFADIPWTTAARCLLVGYFLKTVCADNLKDYTFWIAYPYYQSLSSVTAVVLLFGYSVQIFADFAGYSLIAIGLAYLFGYELPPNFDFPYISKSLAEFWRRWHISLSTWLRDYLYIPLGGNRKGSARTYLNLLAVMAFGGLWHGAGWSYLVWGVYHGAGLALERLVVGNRIERDGEPARSLGQSALRAARTLGVFVFVSLGWLLFKLTDVGEALGYLRVIATNRGMGVDVTRVAPVLIYSLPVALYYAWNLPGVRRFRYEGDASRLRLPRVIEATAFGVVVFALFTNGGGAGEFIYFQF